MYTLEELLGDHPKVKVIQALMDNFYEEVSIPFISEVSGVPKSTVYSYFKGFLEKGIILRTGTMRNRSKDTKLFSLNFENDKVRALMDIQSAMTGSMMKEKTREYGNMSIFEEMLEKRKREKRPRRVNTTYFDSTTGELSDVDLGNGILRKNNIDDASDYGIPYCQ